LELLDGGGMPTAKTLSVELKHNENVASILDSENVNEMPMGQPQWRIKRLRYLNRTPVAGS